MSETNLHAEKAIVIAQNFLNQGQLKQALKTLNIAFLQDPKNTQLSLELSRLCLKINKKKDAAKVLEKSVASGNQSAEVLYMLASTLYLNQQIEQAKLTINTMIRLHPEFNQAYNLLGNILYQQQDVTNAQKAYERSLSLSPNNVNTINNLAWLLRAEGKTLDSSRLFRQAIKLQPNTTEAIFGLSMLCPDQDILDFVAQARKKFTFNPRQEAELLFAQAKAYEKASLIGQAFDSYQKANNQWKKVKPFELEEEKRFFRAIKKTFTSNENSPAKELKLDAPTPIFIVGLPRSSTTLVEQILASHSQVSAAGELSYLPSIAMPLLGSNINTNEIEQIRDRYLQQIKRLANNKAYVIDKLPQNFLLIGLIQQCFPNAKIIHCTRNSIDHCISLFKHHFPMSNHDYIYSLDDIAAYYHLYKDIMVHWQENTPNATHELRYEKLVDNLETEVKALLEHCGLEFENECVEFHNTQRNIRTASSEQVRRKISRDSIDQWKQYEPYLEKLIANLRSYS